MSRYVEQTRSLIADQQDDDVDIYETTFIDKQTCLHNHEVYLVVITMLVMKVSAVKILAERVKHAMGADNVS